MNMNIKNLNFLIDVDDLNLDEVKSMIDEVSNLQIKYPDTEKVGRSLSEFMLFVGGGVTLNVASSYIYDFLKNLMASKEGVFQKKPYAIVETNNDVQIIVENKIDKKALKKLISVALQLGGIRKITIRQKPIN